MAYSKGAWSPYYRSDKVLDNKVGGNDGIFIATTNGGRKFQYLQIDFGVIEVNTTALDLFSFKKNLLSPADHFTSDCHEEGWSLHQPIWVCWVEDRKCWQDWLRTCSIHWECTCRIFWTKFKCGWGHIWCQPTHQWTVPHSTDNCKSIVVHWWGICKESTSTRLKHQARR